MTTYGSVSGMPDDRLAGSFVLGDDGATYRPACHYALQLMSVLVEFGAPPVPLWRSTRYCVSAGAQIRNRVLPHPYDRHMELDPVDGVYFWPAAVLERQES